jgi:serine/threonine-protein kinase
MNEPRKEAEKPEPAQPPRPDSAQHTVTPHADPTATVDGPSLLKSEDPAATVDGPSRLQREDAASLAGESGLDRASSSSLVDASEQTTDQPASVSTPNSGFSGATLDYVPRKASEPPANCDVYLGETVDQVSASDSAKSSPKADSPSSAVGPLAGPQNIAGYEILGVLGRGAMGVVYKARQRGLKRIVALKMILAGEEAEESELNRFRVEAEAAGQLQHPNIVQVHEVGWHNGCPYLSLEFVNGGSLKERLNGTPQPVQAAAQLTQVLAQAIDYAHHQGVVHRDLKPGNVMLEPPRADGSTASSMSATPLVDQLYGTPKVSDFGLAKRLEEDSGQTRSGTILGTPSYMAPEQAFGLSKDVGPLADQHALGAVLYELLTGRPPFRGATMWETIEQVQKQEPVPPSRLQPKVPRDLETICLKCLQKEPTKRYKDAAALAEDLRRFVAGEPILARPVSAPERVIRWCRRNPRLATLVGLILFLIIGGLVGLSYFNIQLSNLNTSLENETKEKEKERKAAVAAKDLAETNYNLAMGQRSLVLDALGKVITEINDRLKKAPGMQALRRELLLNVRKDLDRVAEKLQVNISLADTSKAAAHFQLGQLYLEIGETKEALNQYQKCFDTFEILAKKEPANDKVRANLAVPLTQMGYVHLRLHGDKAKARDCYLQALQLLREIDQHPRNDPVSPIRLKSQLADALHQLGAVIIDNDPAEALKYYQEVLQQRLALVDLLPNKSEAEQKLASSYLMVGGAYLWLRKDAEARPQNQEALKILERLSNDHSDDLGIQRALAFALQRQGDLELRTRNPSQAKKLYARALEIYQSLVNRDKEQVLFQEDLARAQYDLGTAALSEGDPATAKRRYADSKAIRQARSKAEPDNVSIKKDLMITLARCGDHPEAARIAKQISDLPEDGGSLVEVAGCYALCALALDKASLSPNDQKLQTEYAERALQALKKAAEQGYRNVVNLETEPDLKFIQSNEKFKAIIKAMNQKNASLQVDAK